MTLAEWWEHQHAVELREPLPKPQLLVIVWEVCEHPTNTQTQITPAYAEGLVKAGYNARIIDAP